jgi:hypothetical protein
MIVIAAIAALAVSLVWLAGEDQGGIWQSTTSRCSGVGANQQAQGNLLSEGESCVPLRVAGLNFNLAGIDHLQASTFCLPVFTGYQARQIKGEFPVIEGNV